MGVPAQGQAVRQSRLLPFSVEESHTLALSITRAGLRDALREVVKRATQAGGSMSTQKKN